MKAINVKLDDDHRLEVTETVNLDGNPRIDICYLTGSAGQEDMDFSRREAERFARAILRSVATSRRKHPPRKGWP